MTRETVYFAFGLHNHQPIGNFEHIFEEAYQKAYLPYIEVFEEFKFLKCTQHFTGILLDWFERNHPEFIDRLGDLVASGRMELLGGGYYEPILPMLPEEDRIGQIKALTQRIKALFGVTPRGAWIAERVWEPGLAKTLANAGIEYVLLDDSHFRMAGLRQEQLTGYFMTEDEGKTLAVYPILQKLRYLIPFQQPQQTIDFLRQFAELQDKSCAIIADDGEKFGIWPDTYEWVYEKGWLKSFYKALEKEQDWIESLTFSEVKDQLPSQGLVYIPTASYSEMMDWALPAEEGQAIEDFRKEIDPAVLDKYGRFIKGGFWRFFFCKYRESQQMHRKMLAVSDMLKALDPDDMLVHQARHHLWAAQCNCGYWHGVFGGIYLNHIRSANYRNLIQAENLIRKFTGASRYSFQNHDFFRDGGDALEVTVRTAKLLFDLQAGGQLVEWDHLSKAWNLVNTVTRRPEAYHRDLLNLSETTKNSDTTASIHDLHRSKEEGLDKYLIYDPYRRGGNIHHFFPTLVTMEEFRKDPSVDSSNFTTQHFDATASREEDGCEVVFSGRGLVFTSAGELPVSIQQSWRYRDEKEIWSISTTLKNEGKIPLKGYYGLEFGWSMNAGNTFDRYYHINGERPEDPNLGSVAATEGVREVTLHEEWWQIAISFRFDQPVSLWRFPIETISNSEGGFERSYQSSVVIPRWNLEIPPMGEKNLTFVLDVHDLDRKDE